MRILHFPQRGLATASQDRAQVSHPSFEDRRLLPTRRPVAGATEEAGEAEQVAEVVPSSVIVDLIRAEVALEQRGHKHERSNKALPEPKPEARDHVVFVCRSFVLVRSRSTSSQYVNQYQEKNNQGQGGFHRNPSFAYGYEA